jgi:hypothetical protein
VSAGQSLSYATAYVQWEKGGRVGPAPQGTVGEMRAAVYDQAESASAIKVFSKVASVTGIDEAVLAGLKAGRFVVTYTALRRFIERTAHSVAIAEALKDIKTAPPARRWGASAAKNGRAPLIHVTT